MARLGEQWLATPVNRAAQEGGDHLVTTFLNTLKSLLALYGFGSRHATRRRPAAIYIGHR